jgi:adenylate cyclase
VTAAGAPPGGGRPDAPLKILFVDDEPDLAPLIRQTFRRHVRDGRYALAFAGDGVEALQTLDADPEIEIVVTDLNMPRMDGLTLLGHLRERERHHKAIVVTAYGDMENIRTAMNQGAFDFLTKPIDLADLEATIGNARELVGREREAARVRQLIGTFLSEEVAAAVLANPDLATGQRRQVSVLMSDLSGFSALAERLEPERVVELLNVYLGAMTDLVQHYGGTVDEFIGDAVLALFGAPVPREDHAARAAACAVAMQQAMPGINEELAARGLPALEMVAAVNTGEVVVGNIGSTRRAKYGVVGSPVNLTSRIQTLAAPGEVVVSSSTLAAAPGAVQVSESREVELKGFVGPLTVHFVRAVAPVAGVDAAALAVPDTAAPLRPLREPVPVLYHILDGKEVMGEPAPGRLVELSETHALLLGTLPAPPRADLRLALRHPAASGDVYAKVVETAAAPDGGPALTLRLSGVPEAVEAALRTLA